ATGPRGVPAPPPTLFQIGSVTKVYTATLVQQAQAAGVVSLDEPGRAQLQEFMVADPSATIERTRRPACGGPRRRGGAVWASRCGPSSRSSWSPTPAPPSRSRPATCSPTPAASRATTWSTPAGNPTPPTAL